MKVTLYSIADWATFYEVSDSRKVDGPLSWVAVRTKQDGFGFRRMTAEQDPCQLLAAWLLMVEVSARLPRKDRGKLIRAGRPLDARALAMMTGFPESIFTRALNYFATPEQGWLIREEIDLPVSRSASGHPGMVASSDTKNGNPIPSGPVRTNPDASGPSPNTGQDRTGQDIGETSSPSSSTPPGSNDGRAASGELILDDLPPPAPNPAIPFVEVVALYNQMCPSLPRAQLTDARRKSIRARWLECQRSKDDPLAWFSTLFGKAEASDFLSGRRSSDDSPWRCNIDWLIAPRNAVKVMEGSYENKTDGRVSIFDPERFNNTRR